MSLINQFFNKFFVACLGIISIFAIHIAYADCDQNLNDGIQKIIDEDRIKYNIPAVQVSLSCPGEDSPRDFVSGFTTLDATISVTPDHLFQIGSETKSFIAVVILQLEAEGWLSITDPIGNYLPTIPDDWKKITIQQLLNHTSGLFNYADVEEFWKTLLANNFNIQWTMDELIHFVFNKPPYFSVGQGWKYSNTNYLLAGMIIEAVTGNSIDDELNKRLFVPLHLTNTYYLPSAYGEDILTRMAHGYYLNGSTSSVPKDATAYNMSMASSAGAIVSTSHDTAIWLRNLLTSKAILSDVQREKLMNRVSFKNGQPIPSTNGTSGYGLGIIGGINNTVGKGEIWGHGGATVGYKSNMYWLQCNDVIVTTIINQIGRVDDSLFKDIASYIQAKDTKNQCANSITLK